MSVLPIQNSFVAGTAALPAEEINAKLVAANLPTFDAFEKADNNQEVAFGFDRKAVKGMLYDVADGGIPVPYISAPLGIVSSMFTSNFFSKVELEEMTDRYREVVANKMGMNPNDVDENTLKACAQKDPELATALVNIARKRDTHMASNAGGLAAMAAGAAIGTAAIPIPIIGSLIGGMIGYEGGRGLGNYFLDVTNASDPNAIIQAIEDKKNDGQFISVQDVFALKLAQHPELREQVVERHGDNFAMLGETEQREVMAGIPKLYQEALRDAACCNLPQANVRQLIMGEMQLPAANLNTPPTGTVWTSRIMGERQAAANLNRAPVGQPGGWADQVVQQRAVVGPQEQYL